MIGQFGENLHILVSMGTNLHSQTSFLFDGHDVFLFIFFNRKINPKENDNTYALTWNDRNY